MMRGFPQVEDLRRDEDIDGPVLEPQDGGSSVGSPSLAARPDTPHQIENLIEVEGTRVERSTAGTA